MYDSPIKVYEQIPNIISEINNQKNNLVYEAVVKVGVDVDKNELLKALKYDREQYHKGYSDGKADAFADCILENGEYCWQECCETEKCKECKWLGNGDTIWFEQM